MGPNQNFVRASFRHRPDLGRPIRSRWWRAAVAGNGRVAVPVCGVVQCARADLIHIQICYFGSRTQPNGKWSRCRQLDSTSALIDTTWHCHESQSTTKLDRVFWRWCSVVFGTWVAKPKRIGSKSSVRIAKDAIPRTTIYACGRRFCSLLRCRLLGLLLRRRVSPSVIWALLSL